MVIIVGTAILIDSIFDNIISPKFMGSSLKVHPAAVLVTALVAANFIGFVGVIVSAPVLASLQLVGRYVIRKMFDMDPWYERHGDAGETNPQLNLMLVLRTSWRRVYQYFRAKFNLPPADAVRERNPK